MRVSGRAGPGDPVYMLFHDLAKRDPAALDMPAEIPENTGALNNGPDGMKAS